MTLDERPAASPYRDHANVGASRLRHWPCFGIWPLLAAAVVAGPAGWAVRRESRTPSTIACSTAVESDMVAPCLVHDARFVGAPARIACEETPAALEVMLDARNPLSRPHIAVTVVDVAAGGPTVVAAGGMVGADRSGHTYPFALMKPPSSPPSRRSASVSLEPPITTYTPATDDSGGVSPSDARRLLSECVARSGSPNGAMQTMALAIFERSFLPSVIVFAGSLALTLLWMLRRRVLVTRDASGRVDVVERGFFFVRRQVSLAPADIERVSTVHGSYGPLHGARVEILCRGGHADVPISEVFAPLRGGAHQRFAARLNALLARS